MTDQRLDERAGGVPRGGMDHQPGGLVEHDEMIVLEHDVERDVLAHQRRIFRRRRLDFESGAGQDFFRRVERDHAVDGHFAGFDQSLQAGARQRLPRRLGGAA